MVAVVQWHTGDVFRACVDRLHTKCPVSAATRRFEFGMKFALKGENELCGFALLVRSLREFFICFVDESSALCESKGACPQTRYRSPRAQRGARMPDRSSYR